MRINLKKLVSMGYTVDYNEKEQTLSFQGTHYNERAFHALGKVGDMLEFNDREHDELNQAVQQIQDTKALKLASGW